MNYVLIYTVLLGNLQYAIVEPMQSIEQCRRMLPIIRGNDDVVSASCAAILLDKE